MGVKRSHQSDGNGVFQTLCFAAGSFSLPLYLLWARNGIIAASTVKLSVPRLSLRRSKSYQAFASHFLH